MRWWRELLLLTLAACAPAAAAIDPADAGGPADAGLPDPLAVGQQLYAARFNPEVLDRAVTQLEGLDGAEAELLAAQARLFRARAFRRAPTPADRAGALADLERAKTLALRCWERQQPGVSEQAGLEELPAALARAPTEAAPALRVLARVDWELARHREPGTGVGLRRACLAVSARAAQLDAEAEQGAARVLWAMALAVLPKMTGGDFTQSRFEFEQVVAEAPQDIESRVQEAARFAVKSHDRGLFRALLQSALHLDPDQPATWAPEQHLSRKHALWLAHHERELFGR